MAVRLLILSVVRLYLFLLSDSQTWFWHPAQKGWPDIPAVPRLPPLRWWKVNGLKYRLTLIDENAVERLRNAKNAETARADKAESELHSLRSTYQNLLGRWNSLWNEPEYNEAARKVKERKEREARLAAEKQDRYQNILNRFIAEGRATLRAVALSNSSL